MPAQRIHGHRTPNNIQGPDRRQFKDVYKHNAGSHLAALTFEDQRSLVDSIALAAQFFIGYYSATHLRLEQ